MGTIGNLRAPRALFVSAGALTLALPTVAIALELGASSARGATPPPALNASISRSTIYYGESVVVHGSAPAGDSGQRVQLQFEPADRAAWQPLAVATIGARGRFSLRARLQRSGYLRVVGAGGSVRAAAADVAGPAPSAPRRVQVRAKFAIRPRTFDVPAGQAVTLRGHLLPAQGGRTIRLMTHSGHGWSTLARARTGRRGGFTLRYVMPSAGTRWLRVSFAGDRANHGSWAHAGAVTGLVYRVASWYNDGGSTACGFHATYGVASPTLPCGTQVTFVYGGRTIVATVDDRGPYVGGRNYDFNQNVAAALGMYGVATVLASQ